MSTAQRITPELRHWILEQDKAGIAPEQVLQAMRASGWDEEVARRALAQTFEGVLLDRGAGPDVPQAEPALPEPDLASQPAAVWAGDREVRVLLTMKQPRIVLFGGLLAEEECDALRQSAASRLARSETVSAASDGSEVNAARTSQGMFFDRGESELCARIETRIAHLLNWPVDHGEGLQVLRYGVGAEYLPHYDYFDPGHASTAAILERGGQRVATLVIYLNTPQRGGGTVFPDVGLEVAPIKGNAVFFSYAQPLPSSLTLHGGSPVLEGEKWVATKWLRQGVFA